MACGHLSCNPSHVCGPILIFANHERGARGRCHALFTGELFCACKDRERPIRVTFYGLLYSPYGLWRASINPTGAYEFL